MLFEHERLEIIKLMQEEMARKSRYTWSYSESKQEEKREGKKLVYKHSNKVLKCATCA